MRPQQVRVAALELVPEPHVVDVGQPTVPVQPNLDEDMLLAPGRGEAAGRLHQLLHRDALGPLPLGEFGARDSVRAKVGQNLADADQRRLGAVQRPVLPLRIVEPVLPRARVMWWELLRRFVPPYAMPPVDPAPSRGPLDEVESLLDGPRPGAERSRDAPVFRQAEEATQAPA